MIKYAVVLTGLAGCNRCALATGVCCALVGPGMAARMPLERATRHRGAFFMPDSKRAKFQIVLEPFWRVFGFDYEFLKLISKRLDKDYNP